MTGVDFAVTKETTGWDAVFLAEKHRELAHRCDLCRREIFVLLAGARDADRIRVAQSRAHRTPARQDVRAASAGSDELIDRAVAIDDKVVAKPALVHRIDGAQQRRPAGVVDDDRLRIDLELRELPS